MPIIEMINGKLSVDDRPAQWCQWTLVVADVDGTASGQGEGISLPGALGGLPGGSNVRDEAELFSKFDIGIEGESVLKGPDDGRSNLRVKLRARRADDFTGPGLRNRESNPDLGETNELRKADGLLRDLLEGFGRDATSGLSDAAKRSQRLELAKALRTVAAALGAGS